MKTEPPVATTGNIGMKNMSKWKSYKLAFVRINAAIEQEFYIEALALEESIITDRLDSALLGKGLKSEAQQNKLFSLGGVLKEVKKHPNEFKGLSEYMEKNGKKFSVLENWKDERNKFVHNVAHGFPEQAVPVLAEEYGARGKTAALLGKELVRIICNWSKGEIRAVKSAKKA